MGEAGASSAFIDSIDEVLATTFSKSGAAEMKSRVRSLLQQEGLDEMCIRDRLIGARNRRMVLKRLVAGTQKIGIIEPIAALQLLIHTIDQTREREPVSYTHLSSFLIERHTGLPSVLPKRTPDRT